MYFFKLLLLIPLFCKSTQLIKVFTFDKSNGGNISYATIKGAEDLTLPDNFILCTSHLQTSVDGRSFFTIWGTGETPWLSLSVWVSPGQSILWLRNTKQYFRLLNIEQVWLNFWIHTCMQVDTGAGSVTISVNGKEPVVVTVTDLQFQKPKMITEKLFLGLSDQQAPEDPQQFVGSVTNVKLFKDDNTRYVKEIVNNLCEEQGDIIANNNTEWEKHGMVREHDADIWEVCYKKPSYMVAIPEQMDFTQGLNICQKLGGGEMVELRNREDMEYTLALLHNSSCEYLWTPLSDQDLEGEFRNVNTGSLAAYLPWHEGQPDGLDAQNSVVLDIGLHAYRDLAGTWPHTCTSCDLPVEATFSLIGNCKDSYLGKKSLSVIID